MLLAGLGSVRIGKNCDLGLENAALGLRPRAAFSRPQSQFFPMRTSQPANNIYLVQSLKLPHECGPCTIRNSSAAIKRWLLVKPELLWSYSWCTSIDWVERSTKYVLHRKKLYLYLCLVDILVDLQRTVTRVLNRYTRAKYLETVWSTLDLNWHIYVPSQIQDWSDCLQIYLYLYHSDPVGRQESWWWVWAVAVLLRHLPSSLPVNARLRGVLPRW